jgi:glutathione S-transferase
MKLYGTTTSPFVRRVRVVAEEVGEPIDRIETATDEGQLELRKVSAIRKVPVAVVACLPGGDRTLFDSRVIIDWLTTTRGWGSIEPPRDRWREQNLLNAIDTALDSVIQVFYLKRDGLAVDGTAFATRQIERADAIFAWLTSQLNDGKSFDRGFGLAELSVICALDWMDFRKTYDTKRAVGLARLREAWSDRPTLVATRPHA